MLRRVLAAEGVGTGALVAIVVGSGIMAERLSGGNIAVALLANTLATGAGLYVLITLFGPVSGAHFNPVVTWLDRGNRAKPAIIAVQILGGCAGALIAHWMFDAATASLAVKPRTGIGQWLGEFIATAGLMVTIRLGVRYRPVQVPALVAAWIVAAYWFTSSTSFANPAVTIARALTNSFAGIRWIDVAPFILAQMAGGWVGAALSTLFITDMETPCESHDLA